LRLALAAFASFLSREQPYELRGRLWDSMESTLPTTQRHRINAESFRELRLRQHESLAASNQLGRCHTRSID
jgi:hypothetical protein